MPRVPRGCAWSGRAWSATGRLLDVLSDQRIVWVEGDHLPTAMHLAKGAKGVEPIR